MDVNLSGVYGFREWTWELERRLAETDNPESLHGHILRRQIEFNKAVLHLRFQRESRGLEH